MTKGGKKRRAPSRSESQDSAGKYIPQFSKKRKCNNDSDENLERTQSNAELVEDEKTTVQVTEDDTKTEVIEFAVDITGEESCAETDTAGPGDVTTAKQPPGSTGSDEQHDNGDEILLNTTLTAIVEGVDSMHKSSQAAISDEAVMVVEMDPEELEVVAGNMEEKRFIDASTQVEIPDDNATHFKQPVDNKITSDPLIPALLDELSALNRLVMSCKRELETVRRKRDIWMKNNKAVK